MPARVLRCDAGEDQRQERLRQSHPLCDLPLGGLTRYVDDGRLEMSNNVAERAIRPLTLGRKNYLFAGSDDCGRGAAIMYTLIETARFNDIDPEIWLAAVIVRIADHPISKLDELLP
jgi:transposase